MKRGEIWTAAAGADYAGKPRPVVILQDDRFDRTDSITVCPLTSDPTSAAIFRVPIDPSVDNGLRKRSFVMSDKVISIPRTRIGARIGRVSGTDMQNINRAVLVFLGLAG